MSPSTSPTFHSEDSSVTALSATSAVPHKMGNHRMGLRPVPDFQFAFPAPVGHFGRSTSGGFNLRNKLLNEYGWTVEFLDSVQVCLPGWDVRRLMPSPSPGIRMPFRKKTPGHRQALSATGQQKSQTSLLEGVQKIRFVRLRAYLARSMHAQTVSETHFEIPQKIHARLKGHYFRSYEFLVPDRFRVNRKKPRPAPSSTRRIKRSS
ncbi:hypothetical protein C8R46DRAFT_1035908 [Mycena filopes]|nr:hypothetical protein C8R46DRAFT_1035908 [Mycena filopes]